MCAERECGMYHVYMCTVCVGVLCTTLLQAYANNSNVVISTGMVRG